MLVIVLLTMLLSKSETSEGDTVCSTFSRGIENASTLWSSLFYHFEHLADCACSLSGRRLVSFTFFSSLLCFETTDSYPVSFSFSLSQTPFGLLSFRRRGGPHYCVSRASLSALTNPPVSHPSSFRNKIFFVLF
jgi:hypothetical protein